MDRRLWAYVLRHRMRYVFGALALFATATMVMAIPYLSRLAVDAIHAGGDTNAIIAEVGGYASLIVVLALLQGVARTVSRALIFNTGRDIEFELRNDLFKHLEKLPQSYYQRQRTGDLMSRLINDIGAVRLMLGPGLLTFANTPIYCLYAFTLMLIMDWRLTIAALIPFPILLWTVKHFSRAMMEATVKTQERLADMSAFVQENLSGIHVVKAYVREDARTQAFVDMNETFKTQSMVVAKLRGKIFPFIRIVSSLGILVVLYYGGSEVVRGRLTLGSLVAFIGYLHILAWPMMALGWMISIYQRGKAAMSRLGEIFETVPAIASPASPVVPQPIRGEIRFEGVRFCHAAADGIAATNGAPGDGPTASAATLDAATATVVPPILSDVDLVIPAGTKLGVIGRTGSGKSTLAMLIPRLFDVTRGRILVDGVDVRAWDLSALRAAIGFVPQDPFLFSESIGRNIEFAAGRVAEDEILQLVSIAGLDSDLAEFPHGLDTEVGERGITLSGGQKQRLTLARAIAGERRILVLDDALSSVDAQTERRILDELKSVMSGRTSIIISHRVSSVRDADAIIVVEDGRIVERGTHAELLALSGLYAELYQRQRLTEQLEAM